MQRWETYDNKAEQVSKKEEELRELCAKYPNGVPTAESREKLTVAVQESNRLDGVLTGSSFDEGKRARLQEYARRFAGGAPSKEILSNVQKEVDDLKKLEAKEEQLHSVEETAEQSRLREKFARKIA